MLTLPLLNRRHKAGLFLVLIAAGLSLLFEASAKQAAGITLLGIAIAWAVGSNSQLVHWVFAALGAVLMLAPLCYDWYDHHGATKGYKSTVSAFERRIPELAKQYPYEKSETDPQTGIRAGWNGAMWVVLSPGNSTHKIGDEWDGKNWISEPGTPSWAREALQSNVNLEAMPYYERPDYFPPAPFSVIGSFLSRGRVTLPGLALLCVGFGLLFGIRPRKQGA